MKNFKNKFLIVEIILLFAVSMFLYFKKLDKVPSGFYIDEALPSYSAYSILKTGKDEWGKSFPILFRFYGSFNEPIYIYLTSVSEKIFGLNVFAGRFISALSGVLLAIVFYLIVREMEIFKSRLTSFISSILFILSPWMVLYSRTGYEITVAMLLLSLGIYFFLRSLKKSGNIIYSFIFLSISSYAAYSQRIIAPVILLILLLTRKKIFSWKVQKKHLIAAIVLFVVIQIPHLLVLAQTGFFPKSDLFYKDAVISQAEKIRNILPLPLAYLMAFIREFSSRFITYFSPRSLFFLPDPDLQRSIPELSVFYFWMIVPYLAGIALLISKLKDKYAKLILILLVLLPIPASLTRDPFSTHRAFPLILPLMLVIALGIDYFLQKIPRKVFVPGFLLIISFSTLLLWRSYFVLLPGERAIYWGWGYEKLAEEIKKRPNDKFLIDQSRVKPSYVSLAFYLAYPPKEFQKIIKPFELKNYYKQSVFSDNFIFGNVETRNIDWRVDPNVKQIIVGDEYAVSDNQAKEHFLTKEFEIRDSLNRIVFEGYKTNPSKIFVMK